MAALVDAPRFGGRRALIAGVVLAVVGLGVWGISLAFDPRRALFGYLAAYATIVSVAVGALILLMIGHAANAKWLAVLRRQLESVTVVFPALAVLFVPIAVGVGALYVWVDPPASLSAHAKELIAAKGSWLTPAAFVIRAAIYLALFIVPAELLRHWSLARDRGPAPLGDGEALTSRERVFGAAMLPVVGLALTFAAFDWLMSLDPTWYSSMFGIYYFAGGFVAANALLAVIVWRVSRRPDLRTTITPNHFHALGRMVFAFVVFWAYTAYFQGFLIQIANKPIEVTFFIARTQHGWGSVLVAILITQFALPFALFLPRGLKFRAAYTAGVSIIVLIGHVLDVYWIVLPAANGPALTVADVAAPIGIVGACLALAAWRQRGLPLVPTGDPFLEQGRHYESPT